MRVLITGATGFVGSHLIDAYLESGDNDIYGCKRRRSDMSNVEHIKDKIKFVELDIEDMRSCIDTIKDVQPDVIHHLAAQTYVPTSWRAPQQTFVTNVIGIINLLEAVRVNDLDPIFHYAGSSEEYGFIKESELPVTEENLLRPLSPYGVSKVAADLTCQQYYHSYGIRTKITRAFNHTGPRRGEVFVTSNFAKQIVEIEKGKREPIIRVGDLSVKRDFTDVRDIVKAYMLVSKIEDGTPYNICSGTAYLIRHVLDLLISLSMYSGNIRDIEDESRMRPSDVPVLLGSYERFHAMTKWAPRISFTKTMEDLLEYWREKI